MKKGILNIVFLLLFAQTYAEVKLPGLVASHMVLQRDKPIKIWGYAAKGEVVTVTFAGLNKTTTATTPGAKWAVVFPAKKAGGPYTIQVKGTNTITLTDIWMGDVWICSGQSNMEFNLKDALNGDEEVKNATNSKIRLFTVEKRVGLTPSAVASGTWTVCSPETAKYFAAVGYFFARDIQKTVNIPIGLINASWGGTVVESWISSAGLAGEPTFGQRSAALGSFDTAAYNKTHNQLNTEWINKFNSQDIGYKTTPNWLQNTNLSDWKTINLPTVWEFTGQPDFENLDGIVWFKKEIGLTAADIGQNAVLNLGFIQQSDSTFVNGTLVGHTPDIWGKTRNYNVPAGILKAGVNTITVKVANYGGDGGFVSKNELFFMQTAARAIPLTGEWKYKIGYKLTVYDRPEKEFGPNTEPSTLFNGMINPLTQLSIKGVLWYQGESNWFRGFQYRDLFQRMITDWRKQFKQGDFPFLYVQLANHHQKQQYAGDSYWAELREAQSIALRLKNTGMVTAIDIGDAGNIHPTNKQEVGRRLALVAKNTVYKIPVLDRGPGVSSFTIQGNNVLIKFTSVGQGLKIKDGKVLNGFQIAGADKKFTWAIGTLVDKNTVRISSPAVASPVAVRYAWEDNPADANLINSANLPAFPFRTDQWPGFTFNNRL